MADEYPTARPFMPDDHSLDSLEDAAEGCEGCPLYEGAEQAVFGVGPENADIMVVGEQPGTEEDQAGEPFVGPAGGELNRVFEQAGLIREDLYITNAVKHGKFEQTDGRSGANLKVAELDACRPWLEAQIEQVRPEIIVALGTMAARSLTQGPVTIQQAQDVRHKTAEGDDLLVTYHPAASLRAPSDEDQQRIFEAMVRTFDEARRQVAPGRPGTEARP